MGIVTQLLEVIAVLIPDFRALGVSFPVCLSLYCFVTSFGVLRTKSVDSGLLWSLFLGYAVTVALNILSTWLSFGPRHPA